VGKIWERTQNLKMPAKLHRINGPYVLVRAHKSKVVYLDFVLASLLRCSWASRHECKRRLSGNRSGMSERFLNRLQRNPVTSRFKLHP